MQKTLLTYTGFLIACIIVAAAFITATTYTQLIIAALLYPFVAYFALYRFPGKRSRLSPERDENIAQNIDHPAEVVEESKIEHVGISDIDKRVFLKLIGGAGISLFLFSLLNKRAESMFFKKLPSESEQVFLGNIAGNKINPAENQPTDGYNICEIDDDVVSFYGYINKDGSWFVMRVDNDTGSFRYTKGNSNFPLNWTSRKDLSYDYYSNIF